MVNRPYFNTGRPLRYDDGTTYADPNVRLSNETTYEWQHSLSEIVQSVLDAGLVLKALGEHENLPWPALPELVPHDGSFAFPHGRRRSAARLLAGRDPGEPLTAGFLAAGLCTSEPITVG